MKPREIDNWIPPELPARRSNPTTTFLPRARFRAFEPADVPLKSTACCAMCRADAVLLVGDAGTPLEAARAAGWQVQGGRVVCRRCLSRDRERKAGEPRGRTAP